MLRLGVIGYGYWGPNIVRNFLAHPGATVTRLCDSRPAMLEKATAQYPDLACTTDAQELIGASDIDAVAIITPVSAHYPLAKAALEAGKHIFVEKPFTATIEEAEELLELAGKQNLTVMVDHTFLFTPAVRKIKTLVDDGTLGDLYYYDSTRINLGLFQKDVNVIWDLAPHDFSILDYVATSKPVAVSATGFDHFGRQLENMAYVTIDFASNMIAHFNLNWLSPVKVRRTLIGGSNKMLLWDDLSPDEKIKIYDAGVEVNDTEDLYQMMVSYRAGDMWSPRLDQMEALRAEAAYFVECVETGATPFNDGEAGLRVVRLLDATARSLREDSRKVSL